MKRKQKLWWIGLAILAVLLRVVLGYFPEVVEAWYSRGLFIWVRAVLDHTVAYVPFPIVYVVLAWVIWQPVRGVIWLFRTRISWKDRILDSLLSITAFVSIIVFAFLMLWGYNYARVPLETQLDLEVEPLDLSDLREALDSMTLDVNITRQLIRRVDVALTEDNFPTDLKTEMRKNVQTVLRRLGYPHDIHPKVQNLGIDGILLRFSTLGVYFPWTGECNIDGALHIIEKPFVMAHELAHGFGITDEGTCNFLAYLACLESDDLAIHYAGQFEYFSTLAINYRRYDPDGYAKMVDGFSPAVLADWNAIVTQHRKYPNILPELRRSTYDAYLKLQGIEEGIQNYNRVLMLVKAWNKKQASDEAIKQLD